MLSNQLKLNDNKTEIVLIGSRQQLQHLPDINIHIGNETVKPVNKARNLGIIFDSNMNLNDQINHVCKKANHQLIKIKQLRKYLSKKDTETLVHAFITSSIDYCNSIYYNLPKKQILKLQRIQNHAARVITKTRKYDHITPVLKSLHWLPVHYRIIFKIALLVYKSINNLTPTYLKEMIVLSKKK